MLKKLITSLVIRWVMYSRRHWLAVLVLAALSAVAGLDYVRGHLGINTNTADMISRQLDWRRRDIDFDRQFPQFRDTLVVVIDGETPDLADRAARKLGEVLVKDTRLFDAVQRPGRSAFFERNALLYLDTDELGRLADDLSAAQPLLERLGRDPSLYAIARLLDDALKARESFKSAALDRFSVAFARAIEAQLEGRFHQLSWQRLMSGNAVDADANRQLLIVTPRLDFSRLFPASDALQSIRSEAARLSLDPAHGIRVRITGGLAMSDEELRSVSSGMGTTALLALLAVTLVLVLGLGSLRLVCACLVTLLVGLIWTASFAAAAVGQLNMISIAFAVLYIGLGVDYAIHFGLRYRELRMQSRDHDQALAATAGDVGGALALCALTTGIGFLAFLPTDFAGVSELGLIAGAGMFISLFATLSLMPALLTVVRYNRGGFGGVHLPGGDKTGVWLYRHQRRALLGFLALSLIAGAALPYARFDNDPLNLRDGAGEAVSTYRELVVNNNNWSLDILLPDQAQVAASRSQLEALPGISDTRALVDFVPAGQEQKLALIDDLAVLLGPGGTTVGDKTGIIKSAGALQNLGRTLSSNQSISPDLKRLGEALARLQPTLKKIVPAPGLQTDAQAVTVLRQLEKSVLGALPEQLRRLNAGLDAERIDAASLPDSIRRDWQARDGRLRLQINSALDLNQPDKLESFVTQVHSVSPGAVGTPVIHQQAARVVVSAFQQAFALALASIAFLLWLILRNFRHVLFVLIPLLMAGLFSVALMVLFDIPFNFANVIALPLLLGIGVDSGIHMLARTRLEGSPAKLTASVTARAVVVSALTTTLSFGNLAFSAHPGTASMGLLLAIGMFATLVCTLLVLPTLLWRFDTVSVPLAGQNKANFE